MAQDVTPVSITSDRPLEGASTAGETWPLPPLAEGEISLIFMGDTNISYREDPDSAFSEIAATLLTADVLYANLEGPFAGGTDDPEASDAPGKDWRHSNPDQVAALTAAGFDAVGTANNVTLPRDAAMRSLAVLQGAGIAQTGSGANIEAARAPVILERGGLRIGILQRSTLFEQDDHLATADQPGIAGFAVDTLYRPDLRGNKPGRPMRVETRLDPQAVAQWRSDIAALSAVTDIQIVSFHWGLSDAATNVGYEEELARLSIDAGADAVIGHGTHRFKPVEVYAGRPIFYDIGQGLFDDRRNFDAIKGGTRSQRYPEGLMVRLRADRTGVTGAEFVPLWRDTFGDDLLRLYRTDSDVGRQVIEELRVRMRMAYMREPFMIEPEWVRLEGIDPSASD
ncbi:Capsule biosynthesis protein capA [Aurantiacibacter gangjinensis]|nr:Capsule biosynthesis protein capA [Aurantiacibacter gangjinensis]